MFMDSDIAARNALSFLDPDKIGMSGPKNDT